MISKAAIKAEPAASPLERLGDLLAADMKEVNALILRHMASDVPLIPQVARYLIAAGGKRIRPLLTLAAARLYGHDGPRPFGLAAAVEFIHTATLLHDDVVDESAARRGQESANEVFGNQASVLVGDFLFSRAFQLMVADGSLEVLRILSDASAVIAEGEVMQMQTAANPDTTMAQYEAVIGAKTAALFAAACETGPVIAGAGKKDQEALRLYGHNLGMAFQIADDVLDYTADQAKLGKTVGDDFREGKMTAPVILALEGAGAEEKEFWARTMKDGRQTPDDMAQALAYLDGHKACARALALAASYAEKARMALPQDGDGHIRALLEDLAGFAAGRAY